MSIRVLWIWTREETPTEMFWSEPRKREFTDTEMTEAIKFCQELRGDVANTNIIIVSEIAGQVGLHDAGGIIENGMLPNGQPYEWEKRR